MIEVNEYVRTKNKGIRKIDRIDNNKTINKYLYFTGKEDFEGKEYGIIKTTDIVKHSKQLIDLIDFGDFVNGIKVVEKGLDKNDNVSSFSNGHDEVRAKDIKAILTKEQMEANQICCQMRYGNQLKNMKDYMKSAIWEELKH